MPDTYTFRESYELLQTNPKTFQNWLKQAGIDPNEQIDLADPRKKFITREQLALLASHHGRTLPPLEKNDQPAATITLDILAERLAMLQQQQEQGFSLLELTLKQALAMIEGFAHSVPSNGHIVETNGSEVQKGVLVKAATKSPAAAKPRPTTIKKKKKTIRGKKLPAGLMLLRDIAAKHNIATERASAAGKAGKITVIQGKWLVNSRWATEALEAQGQQEFYEVFHESEGFTACEQCPHLRSKIEDVEQVTTRSSSI